MEGRNQHLDFSSLQLTAEQQASANGEATTAERTVVVKSMLASDTQQLASSAPLTQTSNRRIVDSGSTEQAFPHSSTPTPISDPVYQRSTAPSIRSNQTANSLTKKSLLSFRQSKVEAQPASAPRSKFTRNQEPRLPAFLGRHSSITDHRLASPLLPQPLRSRINNQLRTLDQNHDPNIFIGASREAGDAALRKQPVLVPRLIHQATRIAMTSSEISIDGSNGTVSPPASPPSPDQHTHLRNDDNVQSITDGTETLEHAVPKSPSQPEGTTAGATGSPSKQTGGAAAVVAPGPVATEGLPAVPTARPARLTVSSQETFPVRPKSRFKRFRESCRKKVCAWFHF